MYDFKIPFDEMDQTVYVKINTEHRHFYMEWAVFLDDGNGNLTHVDPSVLTEENSNSVNISIRKQIAGTDYYEDLEGSPYAVSSNTNIPHSYIPGANFKIDVSGLTSSQILIGRIYSWY